MLKMSGKGKKKIKYFVLGIDKSMYNNPMHYQLEYSNTIWKHTLHLILS